MRERLDRGLAIEIAMIRTGLVAAAEPRQADWREPGGGGRFGLGEGQGRSFEMSAV